MTRAEMDIKIIRFVHPANYELLLSENVHRKIIIEENYIYINVDAMHKCMFQMK